ncbi:hypothetical protein [Laceyella tengchongensis]
MFKDKWKIATILFLLFVINLYIPHLTFAQTHPWMASKSEQILLADGIELPTIPSNDPIEIPKVEIPSDPIEIPKVKIPENKVEVPKAEIPKAPVQESTGFIDQLLKWLQKQLSLILALLCLGLGLFLLSTNPLVGTSIVMGMAVSGFGAWMADKDVSSIAQEALIGGIAGLIGLGAGALAFRLIGGRIATMAPPWLGKWLPFVGSGGVAGVADSASFDYMRDGKVDWKKAGLAGILSVAIGFAGLGVAQYGGKLIGPAVVSKINDIPLTAVSVFKDGTTSAPKTVGDTPFGAWLQKFASNGGSKGTPKKTSYVSLSKSDIKHFSKHIVFNFSKQVPYLSDDVLKAKLEKNSFFNPKWSTEKIISEVEKGYNEAIQKGITGEYIFNSDGEQITIFIHSDGQFATAYGSHKLNLSYFGR